MAPEAGTGKAAARTTPRYARDRGQFDCFDKTHNATELLALLAHFGLLRHHAVDVPQSRGLLIDLRGYHTTAVVREKASGKQWSVDGWTKEKRTRCRTSCRWSAGCRRTKSSPELEWLAACRRRRSRTAPSPAGFSSMPPTSRSTD